MTHHQYPFCTEMYKLLGDDFLFVYTDEMEDERKNMGWDKAFSEASYIIKYDDETTPRIIMDSDIVLCGSVHMCYIKDRLKTEKITFRYFERLYKKGRIHALKPGGYIRKLNEHTRVRNKNVYLLCAGAYVPADFKLFFSYPEKMLKWGYFTEEEAAEFEELLKIKEGNERTEILWTGRMIDWKYPVMSVLLGEMLSIKGFDFHITMIGDGPEKEGLLQYIQENELERYFTVESFMEPSKVREYMRKADVYLMTSDFNEGWGAVINEAMSSGCVVVASAGAGGAGYLIEHDYNGLIFNTYDMEDLGHEVMRVLCNKSFKRNLAENAYDTMKTLWSPRLAANRFVELCESLLAGEVLSFYEEGPLSKAEIVLPKDGYSKFHI